jgi:hypothetical protein
MVLLMLHQHISLPQLEHNSLRTMQTRLHDVVVNETPQFQCFEPINIFHTINVRGNIMDDVFIIPFDFNGAVACFPTFKPTQDEFYTCDRYGLTYESPA